MFFLRDQRSRDLDVLRTQRIIGFLILITTNGDDKLSGSK